MIKTLLAVLMAAAPAGAADFNLGGVKAENLRTEAAVAVPEPARAAPAEITNRQWQKMQLTLTYDEARKTYTGSNGELSLAVSQAADRPGNFTFRATLAGGGAVSGTIKDGVAADTAGNTIDLSRDPFEYPAFIGGRPYTLLGNCAYDQGFVDTLTDGPYESAGLSLNRKVKGDKTVRITGSYDAGRFSRGELALILTAYIVLQ